MLRPLQGASEAAHFVANMEVRTILERNDIVARDRWIDHHIKGDWFTSRLLKLIATADPSNKTKLALGYPDEVNIWIWWSTGRNPHHGS